MTGTSMNTVSDERLAHYIEYADLVGDNGTPAISTGELAAMARELQSLRSPIPGGVGVKVKPLEWGKVTDQTPKHAYAAYTPFGRCLIVCEFLSANHMVYRFNETDYQALDEAKAAAQADYERRILSALDLSPAEGEPSWFAAQSVTGSHIGLWRDEQIARRVFEQEYPNGALIPLHAAPSNPVISDEWQPIESAPKNGTLFLAAQDEWVYRCQWLEEEPDECAPKSGWFDLENLSFENPTHWMPLPVAPAALSVKPQSDI